MYRDSIQRDRSRIPLASRSPHSIGHPPPDFSVLGCGRPSHASASSRSNASLRWPAPELVRKAARTGGRRHPDAIAPRASRRITANSCRASFQLALSWPPARAAVCPWTRLAALRHRCARNQLRAIETRCSSVVLVCRVEERRSLRSEQTRQGIRNHTGPC